MKKMRPVAEFRIDFLPKLPNQIMYSHWTKKRNEAKRWKALILTHCILHKIKDLKLNKSRITFTRHSSQEPDKINNAASFKHVLDGLTQAGVIVDDAPEFVDDIYTWEKTTRLDGHITIRIEEVEE